MKIPAKSSTAGLGILFSLSLTHLFNDLFQSTVNAVYPVIRDNLGLSFCVLPESNSGNASLASFML